MKFLESKPKSFIYTILLYIFAVFEMSVLSSYRFVEIGTAADKYSTGMSANKVATFKLVTENIGWNFIVWSFLLILLIWGFSMLLGYNRNPWGVVAIAVMNVIPLIGIFTNFNFFFGYGYAIYAPAMSVFGLTFCENHSQQVVNNIIFAAIVVVVAVICWIIGYRIRAAYAKKYEYDD